MSFVGELAGRFGLLAAYPNVEAWVRRFEARPAYERALEKGGEYHLLLKK
jgi:glutathione S-transferase